MTDNDNNMEPIIEGSYYSTKGIGPGDFGDIVTDMDEPKGEFTAIFAVHNVIDHDKERILPGYLSEQIESGIKPKVVWSHDDKKPIGKVIEWAELPENHPGLPEKVRPYGGLRATVQLNMKKEFSREIFTDIVGGFIDQYSLGSFVRKSQKNLGLGCKDLIKGFCKELSPCLYGANPLTQTESTKSLDRAVDIEVYTWVDLQYELVKARFGEQYARDDD